MQVQNERSQNEIIQVLQRQVDELTAANAVLQEELANKEQFTAMIAHELRGPLAPFNSFVVDLPDTPLFGRWDAGRLQQALGNLLDNAIKYSGDGTTITVRAWQVGNVAHVSVHNQGVSISSADIGQLFQPYGRLQTSNKREGSGLGLYITKCIVEAHGGSLRLEPRAEGSDAEQGTMFSFDLPMG